MHVLLPELTGLTGKGNLIQMLVWTSGKKYIFCWYYRFIVQPEGEPGDDHDHEARDVDGDDVEGELTGEHEVHPEAGVLPGGRGHVAILVGVVGHLEAPG